MRICPISNIELKFPLLLMDALQDCLSRPGNHIRGWHLIDAASQDERLFTETINGAIQGYLAEQPLGKRVLAFQYSRGDGSVRIIVWVLGSTFKVVAADTARPDEQALFSQLLYLLRDCPWEELEYLDFIQE